MIVMGLLDRAIAWNVTPAERAAAYPCDELLPPPRHELWRGTDVDASVPVLFRWVCQLKVAPYSYDVLDNLGRRSPRQLTPGAEELAVGQPFLVFEIASFERDRHITGMARPPFTRLYGPLSVTYAVAGRGDVGSRLIVKLDVAARTRWQRLRSNLLAYGDLIMMRKQLLLLKELAEA
jgi:hypothetical protein